MKKIILFLAIAGALFFCFYPPQTGSAQSGAEFRNVEVTEHVIDISEDINDKKVAQLYNNLYKIDSLNKEIKQQKLAVRKKKPVPVVMRKERNWWVKMTSIFRK